MEFFQRAKTIRLRSQHNKYMVAHDDEESVKQTRSGSSKAARWAVESIDGKPNVIRLKSCQSWKYLAASEEPFLLGMTGKKVVQASPRLRLDPTVEWEPINDGSHVKLRTRRGNFLRANGGIPPWNNSVTHDVPSRSATRDWIVWTVEVLEVDYQASESGGSNDNVVDPPVMDSGRVSGELSRTSSYSSVTVSKTAEEVEEEEEEFKDYYEVGSPARSVHSSMEIPTPSPRASPKASAQSTGVSPQVQHLRNESQHSSSFNKLKSMLDGLQDILDQEENTNSADHEDYSDYSSTEYHSRPHTLEVKMAKQTLKELKTMDFEQVLSSGRDKKLEKAVNILIADAKMSSQGQLPKHIVGLPDQIKSMRNDHESASQDLELSTTFVKRRLEVKAELKKDAAKAHELETMEVGFTNMLTAARKKREELLKQLEDVENSIQAAERAQADNAVEIEALITRIGEKSESLREMERQEKSWNGRKLEAEKTLERVEEDWVQVKSLFRDV